MTALGEQLAESGRYPSTVIADAAITAGQVTRDGNGQVRCAGSETPIVASVPAAGQVSSLTLTQNRGHKGAGANKW